jgi:EF-P beta-lysylation protein EpmB
MKGAMIARSPADGQGKDAGEPWQRALQTVIGDVDELLAVLGLARRDVDIDDDDDDGQAFALRVPRAFVARMQPGRADDPLLRQVLPLRAERLPLPGFSCDPLAEAQAMRQPGLLHKFHGRVLLLVSGHCPIHCRYCFRRHFPYAATQPARGDWQRVFDGIAGDPSISEVILSGGDPLSVPDRQLQWLIDGLAALPQLRRLRLHSRLPVLIPERVTARLVQLLADCRLPVSLVIHANHAQELDEAVAAALAPLRRAGVTLLNQSVLLAGVNDRLDTLCALSERLFAIGVLPYYLHLLDRVAGAGHFAVADERVHELHAGLLARLPGYLVPRLVREVAQAPSKVPLPLVAAG